MSSLDDFSISFSDYNPNNGQTSQRNFSKNQNQEKLGKISSTSALQKQIVNTYSYQVNSKILSANWDQEENYLAVGCEDSKIYVFSPKKKALQFQLNSEDINPIAAVKWKPLTLQNILCSAHINGVINFWDVSKQQNVKSYQEVGNQIFTLDFDKFGFNYATAGSDLAIRIYDAKNQTLCSKLNRSSKYCSLNGHKNRIYSVKFDPQNPNILYSGGWDETLFIWDIRTSVLANQIYGPLICGDSLDICGNQILTGNWRNKRQIEIFESRTLKNLVSFDWELENDELLQEKPFIFTCAFSKKDAEYIVASCNGNFELRIFDCKNQYQVLDRIKNLKSGVFAVDFGKYNDNFCFGGAEGKIFVAKIQ